MKRALIFLILAAVAAPLPADVNFLDFGSGPAKWWMTRDEERAWKNVKTEDQAIDFADLFWARRDPTPETGRNENRIEFDRRVAYADANFKEGARRGALTERGRVLILLGFPTEFQSFGDSNTGRLGNTAEGSTDPTGGRTLAAKDTWNYSHADSVKFNMPKIEVVFIHDLRGGGAHRDPQRTDFSMALSSAIKSYIVSPALTTVPEWASSRFRNDPVSETEHTEMVTTETVIKTQTIVDGPAPIAKPAGIGRLMLLNDSMALQPQSGSDPFAPFTSVTQFKKDRELGWAAEYCSGQVSANVPSMKVQLKIAAPTGDTFTTDPEEFEPDSIKSDPGCYLVRGALPLSEFDAGAYKVTLTITPPDASQSYNLTREFRVE